MNNYLVSFVVVYYDKDEHFMTTLAKSLPTWAEWVFVKSVQDGTDTEVKRVKNVVQANYNYKGMFNFRDSKRYAKQFATGKWIFWLDDDEHLDIFQHDYIKDVLNNVPEDVGGLFCTQYSWLQGITKGTHNVREATATVRISLNIPPINWVGADVHDVLEPTILESGYKILDTNIRILHDGWLISKEEMIERLERNLYRLWRSDYTIGTEFEERYMNYLIDTGYTLKTMKGY